MSRPWSFWIDRGGTFTDCIAHAPSGERHTAKVLSSENAPLVAIRQVLEAAGEVASGDTLPACDVKLGTTVATNALLERGGRRTLLVTNAGLGDVLTIGTQERPDLFDLDIRRPAPLAERVVECGVRQRADGVVEGVLDEAELALALSEAKTLGLESVAVLFIHAHAHPELEGRVAKLARQAGFSDVVCSHEVAREIGFLARGETVCADAYLTPLLAAHTERLERELPGSRLRFMQSSGGLTDAGRFRGPGALLSGPAGGVVATADVARRAGHDGAIGFDMGGTSTDVSLVLGGEVDRAFETLVAGLRVRAPMLRIHTVAAGGGSLCRFDGFRQTVGPESAGSKPGPLCYRLRDEVGDPLARELAVTDVNLFLGRVQADRFAFEVDVDPVRAALERVQAELAGAGFERSLDEVAAGFIEIANASMAEAIVEVSVARGVDPRGLALVGFGGAGGQHVCAIARQLGMKTVLLHPLAGLLSAWGIGTAPFTWDGQRDGAAVTLGRDGAEIEPAVEAALRELAEHGQAALLRDGLTAEALRTERWLDLRYRGTDHALPVREPEAGAAAFAEAFEQEHRARFGYHRPEREIEIVTARVRVLGREEAGAEVDGAAASPSVSASFAAPEPLRSDAIWFPGVGRVEAPIHLRESLAVGTELTGPAVLLEATGTVVVDPGFSLRVGAGGVLVLTDDDLADRADAAPGTPSTGHAHDDEADPVRLEVFGARFKSMAEQMGAVLRNTSVSTNIKDRLDYSCAVFDETGGLVANAPHIPVHLGAMAETVRKVQARFVEIDQPLAPGDVVVTNDPAYGGSHLPDVTVVTPVFLPGDSGEGPAFFVASRGHHAEIGGRTPGSMPPDSTRLAEEGIVLEPFKAVSAGHFDEAGLRARLAAGPWPSRRPDDNVADLSAMIAANTLGEQLLQTFAAQAGLERVRTTMHQLQRTAAAKVEAEIARFEDGEYRFEDRLDDGTPVCVTLRIAGGRMQVDFTGTGPPHPGNLNAPSAVVSAALIYVLRSLVDARLPLNGGCLDPVELTIPSPSLLAPPEGAAVVGGNVETSQRVVDVLLGALGIAAASQGTMNNVTFGDARFGYYETIGGGAGAGPGRVGASGVHTHMTNTRITDPEVLEARYPVLLERFALRAGSGGAGRWSGGDGLVREYRFLAPVTATLLTERRTVAPWGGEGGEAGAPGENRVIRVDGEETVLGGRCSVELSPGDRLRVSTPGGGGWGRVGS